MGEHFMDEYLLVLGERRDWLTERIKAKKLVAWDVEWDTRERDALAEVIGWVEDLIDA